MSFQNYYFEMAPPRPEDLSRVYYHGTPKPEAALSIFQSGIQPPDLTLRKGKLRPVEGKVYMTPDIGYAQIYSLGANMADSDMSSMISRGEPRHGYLFVIDGNEIKDIQPDEDSVGEFIYYSLRDDNYIRKNNLWWLMDIASRRLTPLQIRKIKDGEYEEFAHAGKKLMKFITDQQKMSLIDLGAHIAHGGAIIPKELWRIDKMMSKELKKDGSNFFDIAVKVNSKEDII